VILPDSIYDDFVERLVARTKQIKVGDALDYESDMGPLVSEAQRDTVENYVRIGQEEGARLVVGGRRPEHLDRGYFYEPTIFTEVDNAMTIAQEEIFGPVLSVMTFRTEAEAVAKANNTPYGLSAGVWTEKGSRILWMADRLRAGVVWANTFNRFDPASPFGGYKESGFGREGGRHGLEPYVRLG
jgi:aldehyde dehydrogenase (NAD+)